MTQNKKITIIIIIIGIATLFSILLIRDTSAQSASVWFPDGQGDSYLVPVDSLWGLKVPGLATSTTGCLGVNSTGWISASGSACGTGVGGGGDNPGFDFITIGGTSHSASSTRPFYFGQGLLAASSTLGYLNVGYINATSTTATSTFAGGLTVNGTGFVVNQGVPANSFIVNTNGNVGIGTAVPQALLSLAEGTTAAGGIQFGSDTYLYRDGTGQLTLAGNTSTTNHGVLAITNSDSNENGAIITGFNPTLNTGNAVGIVWGEDSSAYNSTYFQFVKVGDNSSSNRMDMGFSNVSNFLSITGLTNATFSGALTVQGAGNSQFTGNVGIGIDPVYPFAVSGVTYLSNGNGDNFLPYTDGNDYISAPNIIFRNSSNGEVARIITSTGSVGIGTTSPYSLLSISNSASTAANTPLFTIASTTAGTATSTLMTVLANGNVGIGTASPTSKLQVTDIGNTYISLNSTANTPEVALSMNTNTDSSNLWLTGINDDSAKNYSITYGPAITLAGTKFLITTTGNVGIGTTTPGQKLSVAGDILGNNIIGSYFTGTSTATSTFAGGASIAGLATTKGLTITGGSLNLNATNYTVLDGNGLISTSGTLAVGAGTCITVNANDFAVTSNCTDAATVDSIEGASLLRSNASDNYTSGTLTFDAATTLSIAGTLNYTNSATSSFKGGILTSQGFSGFFGSFRNLELGDGTASSTLKFDTSDGGQITIATSTSGRDVVLGATVKTFWGVSIASTTIDLGAGFGRANAIIPIPAKHYGYSISHIQCSTWGGTNVVVDLGPDNSAGSNDITCTPTSTTTRQRITGSNVFTFGQGGFLRIISQSGTNNWVFITAVGTTTPQ